MGKISKWFPPFTGVLFVGFVVAITILIGQGQDATKKTAQEIVNHYNDHNTRESIGAILIVFAASLILYFGGWLRRLLRDAEGPDGILSAVAFGGAIAFAAGAAVAGSIHLALADLADNINPVALQAINGIDFDMFFFFPVGLGTLVLATGISAVRHGALPKWLAWVSVVLGVLFFTPAFFIFFFIGPVWFLVVSIWGIRHELGAGKAPTAPAAPAAP
jgi:hypothetical protein